MQSEKNILVLGTGLFAEEVGGMIAEMDGFNLTGFVEGIDRDRCGKSLLGRPVHWVEEIEPNASSAFGICAVGSPERRTFIRQASERGLSFTTVIHPSAVVSGSSTIDEGSFICPGCVIASQVTIGSHVIINRGCLIGHHDTIGSFTTISPGANMAGDVKIGEGTYIGMGAVILDGRRVGEGAVVGAGSVVTRDIPDRVQVLGLPARITKRL